MEQKKIYMDYAATAPLDEQVLKDMMPYFSEKYGNPSSVHGFGEEAQKGVIEARQQLADLFGSEISEIAFTSGATEGNNTVIKGIAMSPKVWEMHGGKPHIIVSDIEHDCVLDSAKRVMKDGLADVSYAPVNKEGRVDIEELKKLIRPNTVLISVMYANNETGMIQPIEEIGRMISELNGSRDKKIYFHTDAAQAVNYLDCNVLRLGVDLMTISAHKIYGPKGAGALYIRKGTPIVKFMDGGEQEFRMRSGTHNVPGIVGLGSAASRLGAYKEKNEEIKKLRDRLIDGILSAVPRSALNGLKENRLPNNANIRFEGAEGEAILVLLNGSGVAVSTGSACAAKSLSPSHVLKAMGLTDLDAHSSIRFSLGRGTTEQQVDHVISVMPGIIEKLRGVSGSFASTDSTSSPQAGSPHTGQAAQVTSADPADLPQDDDHHQENVFWDDDVIDRGGLPADLGCEKNNIPDKEA
jgi:cysteine desulfurase